MPIKFWRIPFHCYQSGGGSRFIGILMMSRYFDNPAYSGELTISDY